MAENGFAILVNTTDSFEDCWIPFFTLFKKYWPTFSGTIYLNTETKSFSFDGLNIVSIKNNVDYPGRKPTWSECLNRALDFIPESLVLYMQDDYFLHDFVKNDLINEFAGLLNMTDIDCIQLTDQATPGPFSQTGYNELLRIDEKAPYRISTQTALWKKVVLKQYIRKNEDAWQFEQYATRRARVLKHNLFIVDTCIYVKGQNEIVPYIFTGIIKGKWNKEVVVLFKKHEFNINYSIRGFFEPGNKKSILKKINNMKFYVKNLRSEFNLLILKVCQN